MNTYRNIANTQLSKPNFLDNTALLPNNPQPNTPSFSASRGLNFADVLGGAQTLAQAWNAFMNYDLSRKQYRANRNAYNINLDMQTSLLNRDLFNKDMLRSNYLNQEPRYNTFQEWLTNSPDAYKNKGV